MDRQRGGNEHDRGRAAVDRRPQGDLDLVALRELARDKQAQPVAAGQVELRRVGQVGIDLGEALWRDAKSAVFDLNGEAAADDVALDSHRGIGRREHRCVLGKLGDQVDDVRHRVTGNGRGCAGQHSDSGVILHLGDGGAQHVDERHRLPPASGWCLAGQDDQAFGVAPHAGGEVVDPEQVFQLIWLSGAPLHAVEQGQLAVQQRLAAAGQVAENVADAPA